MKKHFKLCGVCGQPIILYSEDKKDCYYDICVSGHVLRRALTVKMMKSSIEQLHHDWKSEGYDMLIVQDAICPAYIHLIPIPYARAENVLR